MKRDMDLVRELLLKLESYPLRHGAIASIKADDENLAVPGYDPDTIGFHLDLIQEAGLIDDGGMRPMRGIGSRRLTWSGFDYLDTIRDPELWSKTKEGANAVKSWSFDTIKEIGKGLIKTQIEEYTGVKIG